MQKYQIMWVSFRATVTKKKEWIIRCMKKPEIYKPFCFLIVIFGLFQLSGFAVLANYSIVLVKVSNPKGSAKNRYSY